MAIFTVPALIILFGGVARVLVKYVITKALLVLGLGFVTYLGIDTLVSNIETQVLSNYGSLSADIWNMVTLCGLDVSVTIILSALALSLQIKVVVAGAKMLTNVGR